MFERFKKLLKSRIIQEVPAELSECEFGCRVTQCNHGKWLTCEARIRGMNREIAFSQTTPDHDFSAGRCGPDEGR